MFFLIYLAYLDCDHGPQSKVAVIRKKHRGCYHTFMTFWS